jgi:hypothetical protein
LEEVEFMKAYEEVVEFIAARGPREVIEFKPSDAAQARVWDLIQREKTDGISPAEKEELDHYMEIEHLMRLAKARARQLLAHE